MNAHDKRKGTFDYIFKNVPKYGSKILSSEQIENEVLERAIKRYAPDLDENRDCILGLYDKKNKAKGKKGIIFTDYKMYLCFKKNRNIKVWYDEVETIRLKFLHPKKLVIKTEDGDKYVVKTKDKRVNKKIIEFVNQIKDYNEEISTPKYDLNHLKMMKQESDLGKAAGIEVGRRIVIEKGFEEEKFHAAQGHGFAAERANDMLDKFEGKRAGIDGDNNLKNGPDRHIKHLDGKIEWIQTKYCKTANASVDACFDENGFRYFDSAGKPMSIEVPKDQYDRAVSAMEKKISAGKVKGISDPKEAKNIIKKGHITYKQAVNIAKAGTIESISYDAVNGMVASTSAFGISAIVSLATSIWNGDGVKVAIKNATYTGVKVGGASFLTSVLASQLSKAGLNSALVNSTEAITKMMGSKFSAAIANAFRSGKAISGAAAMKSAAKILRTNIITSVVTVVVFSLGDLINLIRRRITIIQFLKNFIVLVLSVVASVVGGIGGAALGTLILPGFGSFVGSILLAVVAGALVAHFGRKLLSLFMKEDSEKMIKSIQDEFKVIAEDYLLTANEAEKIIDKLTKKLSLKIMRKMVASKNKQEYAQNLLIPITETQISKRKKIVEPPQEIMLASITRLVDSLNEEIEEGEMA